MALFLSASSSPPFVGEGTRKSGSSSWRVSLSAQERVRIHRGCRMFLRQRGSKEGRQDPSKRHNVPIMHAQRADGGLSLAYFVMPLLPRSICVVQETDTHSTVVKTRPHPRRTTRAQTRIDHREQADR